MFGGLFKVIEDVVDVATLPVRVVTGTIQSIEDEVRETFGLEPSDRQYREAAQIIELARRLRD